MKERKKKKKAVKHLSVPDINFQPFLKTKFELTLELLLIFYLVLLGENLEIMILF